MGDLSHTSRKLSEEKLTARTVQRVEGACDKEDSEGRTDGEAAHFHAWRPAFWLEPDPAVNALNDPTFSPSSRQYTDRR